MIRRSRRVSAACGAGGICYEYNRYVTKITYQSRDASINQVGSDFSSCNHPVAEDEI
jgi:hypothetical protein